MMTHYDCGEQVCSSHLKWLEDAVKRSFRPAAKRGAISEVKNLDTSRALAAFRIYNPSIGKFLSVDPLAHKFPNESPFIYVSNNPLRYTDPTGMEKDDIIVTTESGKELFTLDDGKKEITKMTAAELYKTGTQWFEPSAEKYMPLKSVSPKLSSMSELKYLTLAEIGFYTEMVGQVLEMIT